MAVKNESKLEEKELTLRWIDPDGRIIKFEGMEDHLDISDQVAQIDFDRAGVTGGTLVSVKIDPSIGDKGTVVFMTKSKNAQSDSKAEPEVTQEENTETSNIYTVNGISFKNRGIIFAENDGVWYTLADSINLDDIKKDVPKGSKVEVVISDEKKGKNYIVTSIVPVKNIKENIETTKSEEKAETDNKYKPEPVTEKDVFYKLKAAENWIAKLEKDQQNSIEAQGARNVAYQLVSASLQGQAPEVLVKNKEVIKTLITDLAKHAYKTVQELKNTK